MGFWQKANEFSKELQAASQAKQQRQAAQRKAKKSNDYTRVCKRCDKPRFVHKDLATLAKPSSVALKAGRVASDTALGRSAGRKHTAYLANQATHDRWLSAATCPSCGSTDFTQYAPGKAPAPYQT